ncbi:hypothetical protein [Streptomyces sp. NPDC002221]|uniref:hypothetical protein n=1 Tax=Streptomyces sp. NPDC002221 TaxID=3364639 RepID=UPI003683B481
MSAGTGMSRRPGVPRSGERYQGPAAPELPATAADPARRRGAHCAPPDLPTHLLPIVDALLSGQTDETASRRLGISPRTYSRRVADLLEHLDVSTRFQGGAELIRRSQSAAS